MSAEHEDETDVAQAAPSDLEANDYAVVGGPIWGFSRPSKESHDNGAQGQLAVCGYSDDAEIPLNVVRRLQLVDALEPFPGEPGVWIVPIERMVFGLVREALGKGLTEPAAMEAYVMSGLAECGDDAEPANIRHLIDRSRMAVLALFGAESAVLGARQQVTASAAAPPTGTQGRRHSTSTTKRGRTPDTDPKDDQRIYERWKKSGYFRHEDFARKENLPLRKVKNAIERHRKRVAGQRKKSAPDTSSSPC